MVQGGDFINHNGTGGESIYNSGGPFNDESFKRKHDEPYLLSCANSGPNTNRSQFFITSKPTPHLDGKHVVFGRLVSGFDVFKKMENTPTDNKDKPLDPIVISNCGELIRKTGPTPTSLSTAETETLNKDSKKKKKRSATPSDSSSSDSSSSDSSSSDSDSSSDEKDRKRKRKSSSSKRKSTKKSPKKSKKSTSSSSNSESDREVSSSSSKKEPEVNSEHKFLDRAYSRRNNSGKGGSFQERQARIIEERKAEVRTDSAGRVIKGRGAVGFGGSSGFGSNRREERGSDDRHSSGGSFRRDSWRGNDRRVEERRDNDKRGDDR
ncbi:UNVERIFIED_CONTAM: peptidyl-prolyl cis-trans isomerase cpr6 [Siphonaria sp. JEL0065]|nr:peptidyl-prolyl cis-trans isomerase cpr6 [Siphonaria sp. JEL0065]